MVTIPNGFPFRLGDVELDAAIREMSDPASWPGYDWNYLKPELKSDLLMAGLAERHRRDLVAASNKTLLVAKITLAVAAVALLVSIVLAVSQ